MCGIAAIIGSNDQTEMQIMLKQIEGRGEKTPVFEKIGDSILGNVLLEILDSEKGYQPIFNNDKSVAIVFNGEIYNYQKLKIDLIKKGYNFKTNTDTEVILYLYEEYKEKIIKYLDGMFAFIIYDKSKKSFFAARDAFGIKPLYYAISGNKFYFSSEMKSFLKVKCKSFYELKPGYFIKDGQVNKWYRGLEYIKPQVNINFETAKNKIIKLVTNAIKKRINTNQPICIFYSGGIDSTIILNIAKKSNNNILALIVGHNNADDVIYAKRYCNEQNIKFHHIDFDDKDLLKSIPYIIYRIESFEPNPVRGATLSNFLAKEAHKLGYKIALCGEGSDEIFAGYGDFLKINDEREFFDFQKKLVRDLYRTQLLRVDKTAMGHSLEVRVPFMDMDLVEFSLSLPTKYKIGKIDNKVVTKYILREAFKKDLPEYIYKRKKTTLMKGAGAGKVNRGSGLFFQYANLNISTKEYQNIKNKYSTYNLQDKEAAYYFKIFNKYYKKAKFSSERTVNAQIEINGTR